MKPQLSIYLLFASLTILAGMSCQRSPLPTTPAPNAAFTSTLTFTPTVTVTISLTGSPGTTSTPSPTRTYLITTTFTQTATPTFSITSPFTTTVTGTLTQTPIESATNTVTAAATMTFTPTVTVTNSSTSNPSTATPNQTYSFTPTLTNVPFTFTSSPTLTPVYSYTATMTPCTGIIGDPNKESVQLADWGPMYLNRYQATTDMTLYQMSTYIGPVYYNLVIYADDGTGATPTTFLGQTGVQLAPSTGWAMASLNQPVSITAGNYYWLGEINAPVGLNYFFWETTGNNVTAFEYQSSITISAPPASFSGIIYTGSSSTQISLYANGCGSSGSLTVTSTPTDTSTPTPTTPPFQTFTVTPTMTGCGKVDVYTNALPLNPASAGTTVAGIVFYDYPYDFYCGSATYNISNLNFTVTTSGNLTSQIQQVQLWQGGVGGTLLGTTSFSGSGFSITGSFGNPTFTLAYVFSPTASGVVQTTIAYINGDQNGGSIVGVNLPVASVPLTVVAAPTNTPTVTSTSTATPTMTYSFTSTLTPTGTPGGCSNGGVVSNWGGTLLGDPEGIAVDSSKNVYVGNTDGGYVYKINTSGVASLLAGGGAGTTTNGPGTIASFGSPSGLAVDSLGNVYVADYNNFSTVREISPAGVVSTFAGQAGVTGFLNGPASIALFNTPRGVAVDSLGNVYVADYNNSMVREISTAGTVSTYATVPFPSAITIDTLGNFYVLNGLGFVKITSGSAAATIAAPSGMNFGIAADSCGDLFTASYSSNLIWEVSPSGAPSTLAGGTEGSGNGTGTGASFGMPWGVAVDSSGTVYVADDLNQIVRKIQ